MGVNASFLAMTYSAARRICYSSEPGLIQGSIPNSSIVLVGFCLHWLRRMPCPAGNHTYVIHVI